MTAVVIPKRNQILKMFLTLFFSAEKLSFYTMLTETLKMKKELFAYDGTTHLHTNAILSPQRRILVHDDEQLSDYKVLNFVIVTLKIECILIYLYHC